jgi:hypothetical protein
MLRHTKAGLELQHRRVLEREANAPRLNVTPDTVVYGADDEGNDLDYYTYELARLRAMGTSIATVFGDQTLADAGEALEAAIPALRTIRNPLTHPNDDDRLDDVVWFGSLVRLSPDGRVDYLIDPRYHHHDLAIAYVDQLIDFLRGKVKDAIAADPPLPIDEQIKQRNESN